MERKDNHIDKFLRDPLPDPEVRADDAWAGMSDMLDAAADSEVNGAKWQAQFWKSVGKLKGLLIAISLVVTISAVIALVVFDNKTTDRPTAPASIASEHKNAAGSASTTNPVSEKAKTTINRAHFAGNAAETGSPAASATEAGSTEAGSPAADSIAADSMAADSTAGQIKTRANDGKPVKNNSTRKELSGHVAARGITPQPENSGNAEQPRANAHTRARSAQASVMHERDVHERRYTQEIQPDNTLPNQTNFTPVSHEKEASAPHAKSLLNSLEPLTGHFNGPQIDLSKLVNKPAQHAAQMSRKKRGPIFAHVHFGPEWNINRSVVSTNYMFTGADSNKHPLRLAIPGMFVSKSWNRHTATFIFNPMHSYFGDKQRVAQRVDTIPSADSTLRRVNRNTNFIKAFGLNFALQYQYQVTRGLSVAGGLSYARYSSALLRKETEYSDGTIMDGSYLTARGQETLKSYINPEQWNIRVGILFYSKTVFHNRLQVGINTIIPLSNLSLEGFKNVRTPNAQMSIRFLVR
ncbi:MAG: hypothetical protein J7619_32030 [Dyadobacter sp.]|uniref:hypothetical protein n=1 Tax=Dyadobacter sp. TaxID=1914288 RepID=UPI001B1C32F3|nr:hypothetical protein [Dyadobacter sp.]MBO9617355.1 hypothetical protein [Dyadobacter sp.]